MQKRSLLVLILAIFICQTIEASTPLLSESFEGYDNQDATWLPQGWSLQKSSGLAESWHVTEGDPLLSMVPVGNYCVGIGNSKIAKDENLITPLIDDSGNISLTFKLYYDPIYLYVLDSEHVDFDRYVFLNKETAIDFEVWIAPLDGAPRKVYSLAEKYLAYTLKELGEVSIPNNMESVTINLGPQTAQFNIWFRYVGTNGTYIYLDDIEVTSFNESTQQSLYRHPDSILYWGNDCSDDWNFLPKSIGLLPVNTPLTWQSEITGNAVVNEWSYSTNGNVAYEISNENNLSLVVTPDHTHADRERNNWLEPPILQTTKDGIVYLPYSGDLDVIQYGGASDYPAASGLRHYGLLPFDINSSKLLYSEEYSSATLNSIAQIIQAPDAPFVIKGVWVNCRGELSNESKMRAVIKRVDDNGNILDDCVLVEAECNHDKVCRASGSLDTPAYLTVPFEFSNAIVIEPGCGYAVILENLDSNPITMMPVYADINSAQCFSSALIADKGNVDYIKLEDKAFAINIDGLYPWLTANVDLFDIEPGTSQTEIALDSYYDGSALKVSKLDGSRLPDWIYRVEFEGRYNNTVMRLYSQDSSETSQCELLVYAPGVSQRIMLNKQCSIEDVKGNCRVLDIFNLSGYRVASSTNPGIYIIKYGDGSVEKRVVK